eukprot:1154197-Pelagomonas_calceolata.AAC.1
MLDKKAGTGSTLAKEAKALESMAQPSQYGDPAIRALLLLAASSLWKQRKRSMQFAFGREVGSYIVSEQCVDELKPM